MTSKQTPEAMAFYNPNGLVAAYQQAMKFAGKDGRIATLPDIIDARLASKPGDVSWERYFTTTSTEFVGLSKGGNPIAIVAHGVGPMATFEGIYAAYSHEFKDKSRNRRGGRISQADFLKLEAGGFGEVDVVDLAATWARREYQFSGHAVTRKEISEEPLWRARLGKKWEQYCLYHESFVDAWATERGEKKHTRPCILAMDGANNCSYHDRKMLEYWLKTTPDTAVAHLLSIGQLMNSSHQYHEQDYRRSENRTSLASDVSCHEWWNGIRLAAVRGGVVSDIHPGLDNVTGLMAKLWQHIMRPSDSSGRASGFHALMPFGKEVFTQVPKIGERMDTHEPEFRVTKMERIEGGPETFRTTVGGYHGFFKYGIKEVERIAPKGANAYLLPGEVEIEWHDGNPTHHVAPVEFYHVEIDASQRMLRSADLYNDFALLMELLGMNAA